MSEPLARPSLAAVIITRNEENNIKECLEFLSFCDEIIVVDSGSADRTLEIARSCGAKIFYHGFQDFSSQKNFAIAQAASEWILSVDADERVSAPLQMEIRSLLEEGPKESAYRIPRKTFFLGKLLLHGAVVGDRPLRLFKKTCGSFRQPIHEFFETKGTVGCLREELIHYTTPSIGSLLAKTISYTDLEVRFIRGQKRKVVVWDPLIRAAGVFVVTYLVRKGFLDGIPGFIGAFFAARYTWIKYWKVLWTHPKTTN